ncbi:MAG: hypothetical protein A3F72_21295 [Bacteroidetes bacterium RIFCSPLOWO2_12_FULL_35_15]|nr:MAG: hypothetical protein A3F72_21295 [Bacteroidetes bacterium RIFCSPLOWO2_12_FULL_35_15]
MKKTLTSCFILFTTLYLNAQTALSWQKTYGGSGHEYAWKTIPTSDGGYAFVGFSESNDGDLSGHHGTSTTNDLWVAKINAAGTIQWSKLFGGSEDEEGYDIFQTADNGFMVAGWASSSDGDVTGLHGTAGTDDFWVLKINSAGTLVWNKCFGGTSDDNASAIVQTQTGDFFVGGSTYSSDGDVSGNHSTSNSDFWVIKMNSSGTLLSQKCVGGTDYDEGINMILTSDNGCAIVGRTSSADGDAVGYHGGADMLIAKLNSSLVVEWSKCYGGTETEECNAIVQLTDGSFAALGYSSTQNNGDVTGHHGSQGSDDFWLLKLTSTGVISWAKCYGGDGDDQADGLTKTSDGGFVMCGLTNSTNGDVSGFHSGGFFDPDIWVAKVNSTGVFQWQRCIGGSGQDEAFNVYEEGTGTYVITGFTYSNNYDVTLNHGSADGWILKVTGANGVDELNQQNYFSTSPNPFHEELTLKILTSNSKIEKILIYNLLGKQMKVLENKNFVDGYKIETTDLPKGIYFMEIYGNTIRKIEKVIKE